MTEFATLAAETATAASLAMDAFSVSICIGLCHEKLTLRQALIPASAFGIFQFFMPLTGGEIAEHMGNFFGNWTPWVAAALIVWVAVNMIREAHSDSGEEEFMAITASSITVLAFATSLDALAVGFSIKSMGGSALRLATLAGIITFTLSFIGALIGKKLGSRFGRNSEYVGGGVLLLIAIKIIIEVCFR